MDLFLKKKIVEKNYQALKVLLLSSKNLLQLELKNQTLLVVGYNVILSITIIMNVFCSTSKMPKQVCWKHLSLLGAVCNSPFVSGIKIFFTERIITKLFPPLSVDRANFTTDHKVFKQSDSLGSSKKHQNIRYQNKTVIPQEVFIAWFQLA